jgi:hypothetical protein
MPSTKRTTTPTSSVQGDAILDRPVPIKITNNELRDYNLRKRKPGCTGMFWRPDPTGKIRLAANSDWPRDGAVVRGEMLTVNGEKWLKAHKVMQVGQQWVSAPEGAFLPFEYDNHYYLEPAVAA